MVNFEFKSKILKDLNERDFLYQFTDVQELDKVFLEQNSNIVFYVGFDPTAKSLHVGHLLWIKLVNKLQNAGANPIVIVGGATSKIGDPTWKDSQRVMLNSEIVEENITSINSILKNIIDYKKIKFLNNEDWLSKINYLEFLRDFGSMFSVNKMLAMDSVSTRLQRQQHLSFLEFNYMLLQAYDFLHLFENHGCTLQIGGADQWSNMISGVDLIRRKTGKQAFGMSLNLLTTSDGKKMGKTEKGTVWLDEKLTSHFDFWQYWRNVDDKDTIKFLKLFTNLDIEEINRAEVFVGSKEINEMKIKLADEVTKFVHPTANLKSIHSTAQELFFSLSTRNNLENIPEFEVKKEIPLDEILFITKLAASKTAAKRLIDGKGVKIDGIIAERYETFLLKDSIISAGKKKFAKVKII